jgi:phosphatidylglycerol---prolipoprotein diacylglyceryl transferase
MHPVLLDFELWGSRLTIYAYGAGMVLSVLTVAILGWAIAKRRGLPVWPSLVYTAAIALVMPIGSRALYWAMNPELRESEPDLLTRMQFSGFYMSGGFVAAVAVALIVCRLFRLNGWRMIDALAPALGLGGVVLRCGCFLNGCCFGNPTSLPWGVTFPAGSPAHLHQVADRFDLMFTRSLPVHPTQLYEMTACLIAAAVAWLLYRPRVPDGVPALAAAAWFLAFRWVERYLRADGLLGIGPEWLSTAAYAALIMLCVAAIFRRFSTTVSDKQVVMPPNGSTGGLE